MYMVMPTRRRALGVFLGLALMLAAAPIAVSAATSDLSTDPFTQATCAASATTNHHTEVEPDTFSNGSTIVAAFQVGRIYDGAPARSASPRQPITAAAGKLGFCQVSRNGQPRRASVRTTARPMHPSPLTRSTASG